MRRPANFQSSRAFVVAALACAFAASGCRSDAEPAAEEGPDEGPENSPLAYLPVDIDQIGGFGPYLEEVAHLATNYRLSCAVHTDGRVSCWGEDYVGGLDAEPHRVPRLVDGISNAREVIVTMSAACAITTDDKVSCWGAGSLVNDAHPDYPEYTPPTLIAGLDDVVSLSGGMEHVCALTADGRVGCFGRNNPLSARPVSSNIEVVPIEALENVRDMAVTPNDECQLVALHGDGQLECLSMSFDDEEDEGEYSLRRRDLPLDNVTQVGGHCFVADGRAHCFGQWQVIGRPEEELERSSDPIEIPGLDQVTQVTSNGAHACAVVADGGVYCWGANGQGQLGQDFRFRAMISPSRVPIATAAHQVSVGEHVSCALLDSGHVLCWGSNGTGEIGNGTSYDALVPVPVRAAD